MDTGANTTSMMAAHDVAYVIAIIATALMFTVPLVEITDREGAAVTAETGGAVRIVLAAGVALVVAVRWRPLRAAAVSTGLLLVGGAFAVGVFAHELLVDMWDSDASGGPGPGRIWMVAAAAGAVDGVTLEVAGWRRRISRPIPAR